MYTYIYIYIYTYVCIYKYMSVPASSTLLNTLYHMALHTLHHSGVPASSTLIGGGCLRGTPKMSDCLLHHTHTHTHTHARAHTHTHEITHIHTDTNTDTPTDTQTHTHTKNVRLPVTTHIRTSHGSHILSHKYERGHSILTSRICCLISHEAC